MSDLTKRKMQAEEDANLHIKAKDFQHTSAYKILSGSAQAGPAETSGQALNRQLMRRAQAKQLGISLNYEESKLANNMYGKEAFSADDADKRREKLGRKRRLNRLEREGDQQSGERRFGDDATGRPIAPPQRGANDSGSAQQVDITALRNQARERFGSQPNQPGRYNPYG